MADQARYAVGIDLGTTNSVLAWAELGHDPIRVETLAVPQQVAPAMVEPRRLLPSFLYLPPASEAGEDVVGEHARQKAAEAPSATVAAAKSWLGHHRVDRRAAILPWQAPEGQRQVSPVEASRRYLAYLAGAWNQAFPDAPLSAQKVVLTVPASFDASARDLTREAALAAGLPADMILLEEPQAALYAWLAGRGESWRRELAAGDTLLVVDVGGGTTDLTLVGVESEDGELVLRRIAVGDHLLIGGDNMDLALAHLAQQRFAEQGVAVDAWQSVALWHACRTAKERLLGPETPASVPVTVLGRGRRLIGGTIAIELGREEVLATLLEGFFPFCAANDRPARRPAVGLRELGLPFETDAAITRHLAQLLARHGAEGAPRRPTHVLWNGGVLRSPVLRSRLLEVLGSWLGAGAAPRELVGNDLDEAVARGAAYYGAAKEGRGVRIRGGTARSSYVGIETSGPAVPGAPRPLRALCVVPFGMEEGERLAVPGAEVGLTVGESARFRFFGSTARPDDRPGDLLDPAATAELTETDALEAVLPPAAGIEEDFVPVRFETHLTELGVLELWCVSTVSEDRWKLEFSLREGG